MTLDLKIQPLRYVLAVYDEGSFQSAAQKLFRSQPALSMAIRSLEDKLGHPLFEKHHKGQLTPFGEYCLPKFRELVQLHNRIDLELTMIAQGQQGSVTLATVPSVASRLMPAILERFIAEHPDININLHDENSDFVCRMVAQGEVDLGISSTWVKDERLDFTSLIADKIGVVMHREHRLAKATELRWDQLLEERFIANGTSRFLENTPAISLVKNSHFYISNMISLLAMLEARNGITTLPSLAFPQDSQQLCFVPLSEPKLVRQLGIIKLAQRSLSPQAQALERAIVEHLKS